jgi:ribonuclease P protein component
MSKMALSMRIEFPGKKLNPHPDTNAALNPKLGLFLHFSFRSPFVAPRHRLNPVFLRPEQPPTLSLVYTYTFPKYNAETYFSAEQSSPRQGARFSQTHEDGRWPRRSLAPTRTGPQEADRQLGEVVRIPNDSAPGAPAVSNQLAQPESGFPKSVRLLKSSDFRKVYDHGTRNSSPLFAAFCLADPDLHRAGRRAVGFTTPKALGKAVQRNRIRRRVREAARLELSSLSPGWSIVFNPRRKVLDCIFTDLRHEVKRLFIRCGTPSLPGSQESSGGTSA